MTTDFYGLRACPEHYGVYATHRLAYDALSDTLMAVAAATYTPRHRSLVSV